MSTTDGERKDLETQGKKDFSPFYQGVADWISAQLGVPVFGVLISSCIPGALFFILHYACTAGTMFQKEEAHFHLWTWMIGFMIIAAALCLYYATATLKGLFLHIDSVADPQQPKPYLDPLLRTLNNRNFILTGLFFGALNTWMGYLFGVPYLHLAAQVSIYTGFFLVGFVCGMATWGIYGVLVIMNVLAEGRKFQLDFTAPDGCGGTQFLGNAFVKFSAVTLIMGVMISIYILFTWWTGKPTILVMVAIGLWVAFPYFLSTIVLAVPAGSVNRVLVNYKLHQENEFSASLAEKRKLLEQQGLDAEGKKAVEEDIERLAKDRANLYQMWTWPFGKTQGVQYGLVFFGNLFISFESVIPLAPEIKQIIKDFLSTQS